VNTSLRCPSCETVGWKFPGRSDNKINAALAIGGVPLTVQTVENLLDTRIDHVAVLDFEGFAAITDVLGGVTVNNERAFTPVTLPEVTIPPRVK
jgi:polyisoprenyl-teichoic acid--peptidoglycan teichoic acid transferase